MRLSAKNSSIVFYSSIFFGVALVFEFVVILLLRSFLQLAFVSWWEIALELIIIYLFNIAATLIFFHIRKKREKNTFIKMLETRKERSNYLLALDKVKNKLLSINSIELITQIITEFIKETFHIKNVKIYLWEDEKGFFIPYPRNVDIDEVTKFYVFDPFVLWISDNDSVFALKDFESERYSKIKEAAENFFKITKAEVVVPLNLNNSLLGILILSEKENGYELKTNDIEKLAEIKTMSVMSISNATFYARLISLTENLEQKVKERTRELEETQAQLIMSEKMASLGVMVAGIAHEINTPAAVINGSADNFGDNLRYLLESLRTVDQYLIQPEIKASIDVIAGVVHDLENKQFLDSKGKLKTKKMLKQKYIDANIDENLASDISNFILDKNLLSCEEHIYNLTKIGGKPLLDYLSNIVNLYTNLKNIKYAIKSIVRIVRALKYYSHLDQASFSEADLIEGIENTLIIMNTQIKHGIEIIKDYNPIPRVYCNLDELNQVWTNIIQNAIQAMKGHGILTIRAYSKENFACIDIADSGPGIPTEIIDRIWDPFFTTKDQGEGSGLGLGIVKGIIEKHKGKITVQSQPGKTVFTIELPNDRNVVKM